MTLANYDGSVSGTGGLDGPVAHPDHPRLGGSRVLARLIEVGPHGRCDVKGALERLTRRAGLVDYYPADGVPATSTLPGLIGDPWRPGAAETLPGCYPGATGTTDCWVSCWSQPFKDRLPRVYLAASCVTWRFAEAADYATSFVVAVRYPMAWGYTEPGDQKTLARHKALADTFSDAVGRLLAAQPPSDAARALRAAVLRGVDRSASREPEAQEAVAPAPVHAPHEAAAGPDLVDIVIELED